MHVRVQPPSGGVTANAGDDDDQNRVRAEGEEAARPVTSDDGEEARLEDKAAAGRGTHCSPRHPTHFEPSFLQ